MGGFYFSNKKIMFINIQTNVKSHGFMDLDEIMRLWVMVSLGQYGTGLKHNWELS